MTPTIEDVARRIVVKASTAHNLGITYDRLESLDNEITAELAALVEGRDARIADLERQLQEAVGLFKELRGTIKAASHRLEEAANSGVRFLGTHGLLVTGLRKIDDFVKGSPNGE